LSAERERLAIGAFLVSSLFAGGNAVGVRFSNRELAPLWGAGLRFSLAALLLLAAIVVMRLPLPRGRAFAGALVFGALNFGGAFALAYFGLQRIHAGLGQTLLAIVPLATLLLAVLQRQERLRAAAVVGTLLALTGIALMSRAPLRESVPVLSLLALLGSALCFAQAAVVVGSFPPVHPIRRTCPRRPLGARRRLRRCTATCEKLDRARGLEKERVPEYALTPKSIAFRSQDALSHLRH
jgi:drug/metabolite transporter (DMT)-like permease